MRRSATQARELILEAAESQLSRFGPDSLRLKQLAADVGMSHPAILHHFGSRDGLVRAVVDVPPQSPRILAWEAYAGLNQACDLFSRIIQIFSKTLLMNLFNDDIY